MAERNVRCAHPGCGRKAPRGERCTRHDGTYHGFMLCDCEAPEPDNLGQCTGCWRPIPALRRQLRELAVTT